MHGFCHHKMQLDNGIIPGDKWVKDPMGVFHILAKMYRERLLYIMKEESLFPRQIPILTAINSMNGCTQKELGIIFQYKPASITDALKRLEKADLIQRKHDENDLRIVRVYITEKGREQLDKSSEAQKNLESICYEGFSDEEKEQYICLTNKIIKNLDTKEMTE